MGKTRTAVGVVRRGAIVVGAVTVLLVVAACGGDEPSDGPDVGAGGELTTQDAAGVGTVLADPDGMTLYTNEAENDGTIRCVDACTDFWPPLEGPVPTQDVAGVEGAFADVTRPDGGRQVTLGGQPLYTFADDTSPGSAEGDGVEDDFKGDHFVWHAVVVAADPQTPAEDDDGGIY